MSVVGEELRSVARIVVRSFRIASIITLIIVLAAALYAAVQYREARGALQEPLQTPSPPAPSESGTGDATPVPDDCCMNATAVPLPGG